MSSKAFKYRINPNESQKIFLAKSFGCSRFIYNKFLALHIKDHAKGKPFSSYLTNAKKLTKLKKKKGFKWLNEVNAQTLQAALKDLETAFKNFFAKRARFPKFHKRSNQQCIKIPQSFYIGEGKLYIPKLKSDIDIILHRPLEGRQLACYISKTSSGKYYASFSAEVDIKSLPKNKNIIGIDLGLKDLITLSTGEKVENPKHLKNLEKKLKYEQKQYSKKKNGSKNKEKQRKELAKIHEYIANCRKDYLHKVSRKIVNENQVIIAESLKVVNMMKNHKLAKGIQDASWGELIRQIKYKADWAGRTFHQIDTFFASSKTCNNCQYKLEELSLSVREWACPNCNHTHDRDINAALNIKDKGLQDLKELKRLEKAKPIKTKGLRDLVLNKKMGEASCSKVSLRTQKPSTLC